MSDESLTLILPEWKETDQISELINGQVQLWLISWRDHIGHFSYPLNKLDSDKAARFRFEDDRLRYTVSRQVARFLAAKYLNVSNGTIDFNSGLHGKPYLICHGAAVPLKFNLSHSKDYILLGFCLDNEIGIDIEHIDNTRKWIDLSPRYYHSEEQEYLFNGESSLTEEEKFFQIWTLKEAFTKCTGEGLTTPLNEISALSLINSESYGIRSLRPLNEYMGAVSVMGGIESMKYLLYFSTRQRNTVSI